jgi:hypothetical protein
MNRSAYLFMAGEVAWGIAGAVYAAIMARTT